MRFYSNRRRNEKRLAGRFLRSDSRFGKVTVALVCRMDWVRATMEAGDRPGGAAETRDSGKPSGNAKPSLVI